MALLPLLVSALALVLASAPAPSAAAPRPRAAGSGGSGGGSGYAGGGSGGSGARRAYAGRLFGAGGDTDAAGSGPGGAARAAGAGAPPPASRTHADADPLVVNTTSGLLTGVSRNVLGRNVHVFLGIPFAKPPVGPLRFRKPVAAEPWSGILNASTLPNSCFQERYEYFPGFEGEEMWNPNTNISEDCLYLNIWVPQRLRVRHHANNGGGGGSRNDKGHPILVWIYGGGYMSGTSTLDVYNPELVVATSDVIVASMQYRIGAFGFLYLKPALKNSDKGFAEGNMGLWDQALAIQWIKDNAHAFGGNPDLVTLFGESAGAGAVSIHLLSPVTRGLARRGIMQSGTLNAPWSIMTGEKAYNVSRTLLKDIECNETSLDDESQHSKVIACLSTVDAKTLSTQQWNSYWGILGFPSAPTIDGVLIPKSPIEMLKDDVPDDIEIMIGSNQDEGTYFILYDFMDAFEKDKPSALERGKFIEIVEAIFKNASRLERDAILFQYTDWAKLEDGLLNQKMVGDVVGDYFFICPTNLFAEMLADHKVSVYYYYFTQRTSTNLWGEWMGVIHGGEIEYVFGLPLNVTLQYNARERDLSLRMVQAYARFAATGKPVSEDIDWPKYTREQPTYYILNAQHSGLGTGPRASHCAFWNDFLPRLQNVSVAGKCDSAQALVYNGSNYEISGTSSAIWKAKLSAHAALVAALLALAASRHEP